MKQLGAVLVLLGLAGAGWQLPSIAGAEITFAERLGWPAGTVAVILHVDDVGMSHASNRGAIEAFEQGVANSMALMMPCPWIPEIAAYLRRHPHLDAGLHLTLTSEWTRYRWGPLAGKSAVPGLTDPEGYLWKSVPQVALSASPDEVELEIRAQIAKAESMGLPITHLDTHMGALYSRPDFLERFIRVGIEKKIPILAIGGHRTHAPKALPEVEARIPALVRQIWNGGLPVLDDLHTGWSQLDTADQLVALLKEMKPGVTEILFHASRPTEELPLITASSERRGADLAALKDPRVRAVLTERGIVRTTWKELMERRRSAVELP